MVVSRFREQPPPPRIPRIRSRPSPNRPNRPVTIAEVLNAALSSRPHATAIEAASGSWSYAELDDRARRAAGALWSLGVRPGDRVTACLPNDLDIVAAFHGAQRIGAIWAGIGEALTANERGCAQGLRWRFRAVWSGAREGRVRGAQRPHHLRGPLVRLRQVRLFGAAAGTAIPGPAGYEWTWAAAWGEVCG